MLLNLKKTCKKISQNTKWKMYQSRHGELMWQECGGKVMHYKGWGLMLS